MTKLLLKNVHYPNSRNTDRELNEIVLIIGQRALGFLFLQERMIILSWFLSFNAFYQVEVLNLSINTCDVKIH